MSAMKEGGRFLILGIPGDLLDDATKQLIEDVQPAGFILFGRNTKTTPEKLRALTDALRGLVENPIITIDQEGGRVSRLKELSWEENGQRVLAHEPPWAKDLAQKGELGLIQKHGALTAEGLRLFGFNLNLCPVLDLEGVGDQGKNSLGDRTYGATPEDVIRNAAAFNAAMRAGGIASCGKHFPGYSSAPEDPHLGLPVSTRTRAELESMEWPPFQKLLPQLDAIMSAHIVYPELDGKALDGLPKGPPATLSPRILTGILREQWGYQGAVISDDLDMDAIVNLGDFATSSRRALEAGNDLLLVCHRSARPDMMDSVRALAVDLERLPDAIVKRASGSIQKLKSSLQPPTAFSMDAVQAWNQKVGELRVEVLGGEKARLRSAEGGARPAVEQVGQGSASSGNPASLPSIFSKP